jgi:hypothetical protein
VRSRSHIAEIGGISSRREPFTTLCALCRKDWLFFRKEALVSWRTAPSAHDPTAPPALADLGSSW